MSQNELITFTEFYLQNKSSYDAFLFDIDGTLSNSGHPLPGACELLHLLDEDKFPYLLVTNDSGTPPERKVKNFGISSDKLLSSGHALKWWVANSDYDNEKFFLCGMMKYYLDFAGINTATDVSEALECRGVCIGEGPYDWNAIEAAFNLLNKNPHYPLIVANPDSYYPSLRNYGLGIGAGAVARFIVDLLSEVGKKIQIIQLGKPYAPIYQCVFSFLQKTFPEKVFTEYKKIVMLGDSLNSDIYGAKNCNLSSALVLTGITDFKTAKQASGMMRPDMIFRSI